MNQSILWSGSAVGGTQVPPATPSKPSATSIGGLLIALVLGGASGLGALYYTQHGFPWSSDTSSNGVALGRAFVPVLASSLADGFEKAADLLEQGKTVQEANETLKATFLSAREKAFQEKASPAFAAIVPANSEPKDENAKKSYITLFRDFASGLRKAK